MTFAELLICLGALAVAAGVGFYCIHTVAKALDIATRD